MPQTQGQFVWYELMTTDTGAAKTFYGKVVGWGVQDASQPDMAYTLFTLSEEPVSGLMDLPEDARKMGAQPGWLGYIVVDDVDATVGTIKGKGGIVHKEPTDIPGIGRFAVVADPQSATFALIKWASPMPEAAQPEGMKPGRIGWHELAAVDWQKALSFYGELFGWQKSDAVDMGPMGTYQLFSTGGHAVGGMFNKPAEIPMPFWLFYFNVDNIDTAAARVKESGGAILNGPMEVPGGGWILQGKDPQGAVFALFGPKVG